MQRRHNLYNMHAGKYAAVYTPLHVLVPPEGDAVASAGLPPGGTAFSFASVNPGDSSGEAAVVSCAIRPRAMLAACTWMMVVMCM